MLTPTGRRRTFLGQQRQLLRELRLCWRQGGDLRQALLTGQRALYARGSPKGRPVEVYETAPSETRLNTGIITADMIDPHATRRLRLTAQDPDEDPWGRPIDPDEPIHHR